jgi:hypothetical protein
MRVYFHIDELARDAIVASGLKAELENAGGRVIYGNRLTTYHLLRHVNIFDAIILPSLHHYLTAFPDPQKLPNNVYILPTEAIGQATGTLRRIYGKYFGDNYKRNEPWHRSVAGYLLWGHAHTNAFKAYYPEYLQKCRVVGHPRFAKTCILPPGNTVKRKPVVGFVSRFGGLNPYDGRSNFETVRGGMKSTVDESPIYENSQDKDIEDVYYTEVLDFRVMLQLIMALDKERYDITVRPHPRENRQGWIEFSRKTGIPITISPWDQPFTHWLQGIDFVVTPPSTSLYDVYYLGKAAIVISDIVPTRSNHILTESDDNNQILEGVCRPKSIREVLSIIDSGTVPFNNDLVQLRLLEQIGADICENSITNIIHALSELGPSGKPAGAKNNQFASSHLFMVGTLLLSYLRSFRGLLVRRVVQGCNFDLTLHNMRWINRLTRID